jgi:hypothetical protein
MNAILKNTHIIPNRSIEIANLYHKQSLDLINLALTQNKLAIEASHQRASELSEVKDTSKVQSLVTQHMMSQVKDYLGFAVDAYRLGFDAHIEVTKLFQKQIEDGCFLTNEALKAHEISGNPISSIATTFLKTALDASHAVMENAKAATSKAVSSAKTLSSHSK